MKKHKWKIQKQKEFLTCRSADFGTVTCNIKNCAIEAHPVVLFNMDLDGEIGLVFHDFAMLEEFARNILFSLSEHKLKTEGCEHLP